MKDTTNENGKDPAILIVDDDPTICKVLDKILEKEGYDTFIANNGKSAVAIAKKEPVQMVLLDIKMKGMDGIDTLHALKKFDPDITVIMLTAYGTLKTARKAMEYGAYDYVTKPFDMDFLTELIKQGLNQ